MDKAPSFKGFRADASIDMRSHLPRARTRSVTSSPSPSPPPSPQPLPALTNGVPNPAREKRRSFSIRPVVGRPSASRSASFDDRHAGTIIPEEARLKRRRESHSASRPTRTHSRPTTTHRLDVGEPSNADTIAGLGTWSSYSTHAEASISSPGGIADDDDYSSSGTETEKGKTVRSFPGKRSPVPTGFELRPGPGYGSSQKASVSGEETGTTSLGLDAGPKLETHSGMMWSGSNGSESDASRLGVRERLRELVGEGTRNGSPRDSTTHIFNRTAKASPLSSVFSFSIPNASIPPQHHASSTRKPPKQLPALMPLTVHVAGSHSFTITRRRAERGLMVGSMVLAVWRLWRDMGAATEAIELSLLTALVVVYLGARSTSPEHGTPTQDDPVSPIGHAAHLSDHRQLDQSSGPGTTRNRKPHEHGGTGRSSPAPVHSVPRNDAGKVSASDVEDSSIGSRGLVWATSERNYRDCVDDGAAFALLLGPLLAASMYYTTWQTLVTNPSEPRTDEWNIERPRVLDSTPSPMTAFHGSVRVPDNLDQRHPAILALTALCLSRQHAVHLTCLLSLILIFHATWSRRQDLKYLKGEPAGEKEPVAGGSGWVKMSEWRRTWAIISFSLIVTAFVVVLKAIADALGLAEGYDLTYPDIVIATLFFQFSLYVCVRLARRGFTLGELGIICHAATGLFMETVNLTRTRIRVFSIPYIKAYRLPTPLLIFQLALIPGSFLTGFLLSPLLVLSRKIAQRPAHRLRHPQEKELYRKALAAGFYIGAAAICGGPIGFWAKWLLDWRDPWVWVAFWLMEGRHWWSRPFLIAYWGLLAAISVGGWTRQLSRARKRRAWSEVTNANGHSKISINNSTAQAALSHQTPQKSASTAEPRFGHVATQMMDAANQKLPVLSINARRKFFHALATAMFVPGIAIDPAFTHLAFSLAFAAFNFAEYIRYFALYPFGAAVHLFLNEFLDESKDGGTAILSHFYLLTGCASGVWLEGPKTILSIFGALALGIGDALASIVGKRIGKLRWSTTSGKTVEGTIAFVTSVVATGSALMLSGCVGAFSIPVFTLMTSLVAMMEALSEQNDNLTLPIWGWCLGVLLRL